MLSPPDDAHVVIVGAGSAGCAMAARLATETSLKIVLIEAGKDDKWIWLKVPLGIGRVLTGTRALWRFMTQPEPMLDQRRIFWPRGRVLGGTSTVNGMLWVPGEPQAFDEWSTLAGPDWSWAAAEAAYRTLEKRRGGKWVDLSRYGPADPLCDAFIASCRASGIPARTGYEYEGVDYLTLNTRNGMRIGSREAFLRPIAHLPNIVQLTNCCVEKVVTEQGRANAVKVSYRGRRHLVRAHAAVVLCAGAIGSPLLLERSGIGAPERLRALGIDVVAPSREVGENLRDHLHVRLSFKTRYSHTLNDMMKRPFEMARNLLRYAARRDGYFSASTSTVDAIARSAPNLERPDVKLQLHPMTSGDARHPTKITFDSFSGFGIGVFQLRPTSLGSVHLGPDARLDTPIIHANYLATEGDRLTCLSGLRLAQRIARTRPLSDLIIRQVRPPPFSNDDHLMDFVAKTGTTSYHPIGTCRIGRDEGSVVAPNLLVRGTPNLYVADASVMPAMVSSNSNAASVAIGWIGAGILKRILLDYS